VRRIFVHGFTQTADSWKPVLDSLPPGDESTALDVPSGTDFVATALALGDCGGTGTYVGYSMGGRLCLRLALDRPDRVERLVLVSASPGIADASERAARRDADERLAREIEREGADAFVERWLTQPLFASLAPDASGVDVRVRDPAVLTHGLRALGQGTQMPLWDRLGELAMPITLVAGALDQRYVGIARLMEERIPDASVHVVDGAGHALHLERPDALARVLAS
jgi:2-succinyl-6-hydroxy-2,4-cyclohexadiene-1-carboxylate synthase